MENNSTIQNNSADIISEKAMENQGVIENITESAVKKIKKEAEIASGQNVPAIAIYNYLLDKCKKDEDFSKCVLVESKTIPKCFTYITDKAFGIASKQNINADRNTPIGVGMSSDEIFALVNEYFTLDDKVIEERKEAERKEIEEARRVAADTKRAQEKAKADANKKKQPQDKKKNEKESGKPKNPAENDSQISLFD